MLVKARDLINDQSIRVDRCKPQISHFHLLLDSYEILLSNAMGPENFLPGPEAMPDYDSKMQDELLNLFPHFEDGINKGFGVTARLTLKSYEFNILAQVFATQCQDQHVDYLNFA